jgi:hypothetical protein
MLLAHLSKIEDPRRSQGKRYPLAYLVLFGILAVLSGAKSYRDVARFMKKKHENLNELFNLSWKGSPSKSQLRDIYSSLDVNSVELAFRDYSHELNSLTATKEPNQVGLDGKSLRGSFAHEKSQDMLQMLGAFCANTSLILGHVDILEKTNEIPTAQKLISELDLPKGTIYTADALHCQKKPL